MSARLILVVLVVLAAVPSNAGAETLLPTNRQQTAAWAKESVRIARDFWGGKLPCERPRVYAATFDAIERVTGATGAQATTDGCRIWLDDNWLGAFYDSRIDSCTDVVHEYGHALGLDHSPRKRSVMHAGRENNGVVFACYRHFLPNGKGREWRSSHGKPYWLHR